MGRNLAAASSVQLPRPSASRSSHSPTSRASMLLDRSRPRSASNRSIRACSSTDRQELRPRESGRVEDSQRADAKAQLAAQPRLEHDGALQDDRAPERGGGPLRDRVAPARGVDRHAGQRHGHGQAHGHQHHAQRHADQCRDHHGEAASTTQTHQARRSRHGSTALGNDGRRGYVSGDRALLLLRETRPRGRARRRTPTASAGGRGRLNRLMRSTLLTPGSWV